MPGYEGLLGMLSDSRKRAGIMSLAGGLLQNGDRGRHGMLGQMGGMLQMAGMYGGMGDKGADPAQLVQTPPQPQAVPAPAIDPNDPMAVELQRQRQAWGIY